MKSPFALLQKRFFDVLLAVTIEPSYLPISGQNLFQLPWLKSIATPNVVFSSQRSDLKIAAMHLLGRVMLPFVERLAF